MNNSLSSSPVLVSVVGGIFGIIATYITYVASQKVQSKRAARQPKDRIEQIFDGYDRALKQKDEDNHELRRILASVQQRLEASEKDNDNLRAEIDRMKALYHNA